jgi:hypothetical protein
LRLRSPPTFPIRESRLAGRHCFRHAGPADPSVTTSAPKFRQGQQACARLLDENGGRSGRRSHYRRCYSALLVPAGGSALSANSGHPSKARRRAGQSLSSPSTWTRVEIACVLSLCWPGHSAGEPMQSQGGGCFPAILAARSRRWARAATTTARRTQNREGSGGPRDPTRTSGSRSSRPASWP